jgi:GAF domain-containing protein
MALMREKIPSEVAVVSLFDINRREFVVVRQSGAQKSAVLARVPEKASIPQEAMRTKRAVVVADAGADQRARDDRWQAMGVDLRSLVCAPVEVGGRYLGLLELANPSDGGHFTAGDGHALTFIGQQFAEFVAERGVVVDADHVGQAGHLE